MRAKKPIKEGVARTPVVMQLEMLECGAACLTMILANYGKWLPLEQVRSDCGVSKNGSSIRNIAKAAKNYGFDVSAFRMTPKGVRTLASFPCIIHWNNNHFVVLNGFKGGKVYINDPACGSVVVSEEIFDTSFSGMCLLFEPNETFVPSGKRKSLMDYVIVRIKEIRRETAFMVLCAIITAMIGIIQPTFSRIMVDYLTDGRNTEIAVIFLILVFIVGLAQVATEFLKEIYENKIKAKLSVTGASGFFWKVLGLPMEFFSQRLAGDLLLRKKSISNIAITLIQTVAPMLLNILLMVIYLIIMLGYHIPMALIGVAAIAINVVLTDHFNRKRENFERVYLRDNGNLQGVTISSINMIESIKASGNEDGFFERWSGYHANVNNSLIQSNLFEAYYGLASTIATGAANAIILGIGVYLIINGMFTIGMMSAFSAFLLGFTNPALSLATSFKTVNTMKANMDRSDDVMNYEEETMFDCSGREPEYKKLSGTIEMRNVTFGYGKLDRPIIKDFCMKVEKGSKIAIVGGSGCGKSTIAKLLSGLYTPWSGEILFDGKKLSEINEDIFRASVAIVDQDIVLFEDTVTNNITLWDNTIPVEKVMEAAKDADIHNDILKREDGYNEKLIENGRNFSGGQRQRIEIARALVQEPQIIIMDEATSALDAKTENQVVEAISRRNLTCINIAHRLSTIRDCDQIIVLDHGVIVETGTHDELMKQGGIYAGLILNE